MRQKAIELATKDFDEYISRKKPTLDGEYMYSFTSFTFSAEWGEGEHYQVAVRSTEGPITVGYLEKFKNGNGKFEPKKLER